MRNRDKKSDGELLLRLLTVTEDPTFQGNRPKEKIRIIGRFNDRESEDLYDIGNYGKETLH